MDRLEILANVSFMRVHARERVADPRHPFIASHQNHPHPCPQISVPEFP